MKILYIVGIIGAVVFSYILMIALQPAMNVIVVTANASTGNWTAHPDFQLAQGVMNSFPLWQWFLPGLVGFVFIMMIVKSKEI